MQVNILGASIIEEYLQDESFTEKVTFKLNLERIDFVRQRSYILIIEKFFYHIHFAKYFATYTLFLCDTQLLS